MKKTWIWFILIIPFIYTNCSTGNAKKAKEERTFSVINPVIRDTVYFKEFVTEIQSVKNVEIRSRALGQIEKIHVDEGQKVKQGQLLFTINNRKYREDLMKAKAVLKKSSAKVKAAEVDFINMKTLVETEVVSETELQKAEANLESLKAEVDEARTEVDIAARRLSFTEVRAPFTGLIDRIPFKVGSIVEEGTLLTSISDNENVFAYFNVSESEYLEFTLNKKKDSSKKEVSLVLSNSKEYDKKGRIELIQGEFSTSGTISFRAKFPNPSGILRHGLTGKVRVPYPVSKGIIIPQSSTFEIQDKKYVFAVDSTNKVVRKEINPKLSLPNLYVLDSGLTVTDKIIYEGIQNVREGASVNCVVTKFLNQEP